MDILLCSHDGGFDVTMCVPLDTLLASPLPPHLEGPLAKATEVIVIGDHIPAALFDGAPSLSERIARGEARVMLRSKQEQHDYEVMEEAERHRMSAEDRRALSGARHKGPRTAPAHPDAARLIEPPLGPEDLSSRERASVFGDSARPLSGPLAHLVAARIDASEIHRHLEELHDIDLAAAERVRAWRLPPLLGQVIVAPSIDEMAGAIRAVLSERLGDLPFFVEDEHYGAPGKYLHVHATVRAPPDGDEPMSIELYGRIVAVGEIDLCSFEGGRLLLARGGGPFGDDCDPTGRDLPAPLYVVIQSAVYANVRYSGADSPFYL